MLGYDPEELEAVQVVHCTVYGKKTSNFVDEFLLTMTPHYVSRSGVVRSFCFVFLFPMTSVDSIKKGGQIV